jgi:excisionase family DNA binding protein
VKTQRETAKGTEAASVDPLRLRGFMNVKETMEFLAVKQTTIYRLIEQEQLHKFKVRGRTCFSRAEVEQVAKLS